MTLNIVMLGEIEERKEWGFSRIDRGGAIY